MLANLAIRHAQGPAMRNGRRRTLGAESEARAALDAPDGPRGGVAEAAAERGASGASGLPVFAAERPDCAGGPGVEHRYHLGARAAWLRVPGGDPGLVQPVCVGL